MRGEAVTHNCNEMAAAAAATATSSYNELVEAVMVMEEVAMDNCNELAVVAAEMSSHTEEVGMLTLEGVMGRYNEMVGLAVAMHKCSE